MWKVKDKHAKMKRVKLAHQLAVDHVRIYKLRTESLAAGFPLIDALVLRFHREKPPAHHQFSDANHIVLSVGDALGLMKSDASSSRRSKGKNPIMEGQMGERDILPGARLDRLV